MTFSIFSVDEDGNAKVTDAAFSWNLYPEDYMYDQRRGKYLPVRWMAPESLTAGFYDTASDVVGAYRSKYEFPTKLSFKRLYAINKNVWIERKRRSVSLL